MKTLSLDLETYSDIDLQKSGVYAYTASPNFEILLLAYAFNEDDVQIVDLANKEKISDEIVTAIMDETVIKTAYNAQFERTCLSKHLKSHLSPESWQCTMAQAAILGLPLSLEGVALVLGLEVQKMKEGKELIRYFSIPCKSTKSNGGRTRNMPHHAPEKWDTFKSYCKKDVEVEMAIRRKIANYSISQKEQGVYILDQMINDRGVLVDMELVEKAIECDKLYKEDTITKAQMLTGLENPNSVAQLKEWLLENGVELESLSRKNVTELAKETDGEVERLLNMRLQLAKTSVKKYEAIQRTVCPDGRVRGLFQYYGANRTGRFAGRLVQVQNLPQNHLLDLALARSLVKVGKFDTLELLYDSVPNVLSELIRTVFVPREGHRFIVADFSAIEARVLSWIANEKWRIEVFKTHGKIYEAAASIMFHVPIEEITKGSVLRQKGKVAELACIAEGELVLTDKGLIPIENITLNHKLWDGENWVTHKGVVFKGIKEVIEYEGLRATNDHLVWVKGQSRPVYFDDAAICSSHLIQTGNGRSPIRLGENYKPGEEMEQELESLLCTDTMWKLQEYPMDGTRKFKNRKIKGMPKLFSTKTNTNMVRPQTNRSETQMPKQKSSGIPSLWRKRNRVQVQFNFRGRSLDIKKCGECKSKLGDRQDRQQRSLREGKHSFCNKRSKSSKSRAHFINEMGTEVLAIFKKFSNKEVVIGNDKRTDNYRCQHCCRNEKKELEANTSKARVYDILNAGRNNRFTVSGKLVHNCGYGGGVGALESMGAVEMGVAEDELQGLITNWRNSNPNITKLWWDIDRAAIKVVKERTSEIVGKIKLHYERGMMFITLPSGRKLSYIKPRIEPNKFGRDGITYEGIGTTKKWERIETYGPKLVENIIQAIARDLLCEAMLNVSDRGYDIVMHCHDEVITEAPMDFCSVEDVCSIMAINPSWAKGLPLRADGYECMFYRKD